MIFMAWRRKLVKEEENQTVATKDTFMIAKEGEL